MECNRYCSSHGWNVHTERATLWNQQRSNRLPDAMQSNRDRLAYPRDAPAERVTRWYPMNYLKLQSARDCGLSIFHIDRLSMLFNEKLDRIDGIARACFVKRHIAIIIYCIDRMVVTQQQRYGFHVIITGCSVEWRCITEFISHEWKRCLSNELF